MKIDANKYLVLGIVFLAIGITMLMSDAVENVIAYGDLAVGIAFLVLSLRND